MCVCVRVCEINAMTCFLNCVFIYLNNHRKRCRNTHVHTHTDLLPTGSLCAGFHQPEAGQAKASNQQRRPGFWLACRGPGTRAMSGSFTVRTRRTCSFSVHTKHELTVQCSVISISRFPFCASPQVIAIPLIKDILLNPKSRSFKMSTLKNEGPTHHNFLCDLQEQGKKKCSILTSIYTFSS